MTTPSGAIGLTANSDPASLNALFGNLAVQAEQLFLAMGSATLWFNPLTQDQVQALFGFPDGTTAAAMQECVLLMTTLYGVYMGLVQQGGSGGSGATEENFNQGLAPLRAGR